MRGWSPSSWPAWGGGLPKEVSANVVGAIEGLLIDIDGVLTVSWEPIDGAPEAMATLRGLGIPLRFATNTTTRTRAEVASLITSAGMPVEPGEILTAPVASATTTRGPGASCSTLATCPMTWRESSWPTTGPRTDRWTWWSSVGPV